MLQTYYFPTILRPDGSAFSAEAETLEEAEKLKDEFLKPAQINKTQPNQESKKNDSNN